MRDIRLDGTQRTIGQESLGRVIGVHLDELIVKSREGYRTIIRRHLAGLEPGESLDDRYHFGDEVRIRLVGHSKFGRLTFEAIPPTKVLRPVEAPHIIVDASNVARDGEDDPSSTCFGGVGLWAVARTLSRNFDLEIIADANLIYVLDDLLSCRALSVLRSSQGELEMERLSVSGAEADREILQRCEDSGFRKLVLTNDRFQKRKNKDGEVVGRWADIFPWLDDQDIYRRVFVRFNFSGERFVCERLGLDVEVPTWLFE